MDFKNIFKIAQQIMNPRIAEEEEALELERNRKIAADLDLENNIKEQEFITEDLEEKKLELDLALAVALSLDVENNIEDQEFPTEAFKKKGVINGSTLVLENVPAVRDSNSGFRAILGGKHLSISMSRGDIVKQIRHNMDPDIKNLIDNDIKALYEDWILDSEKNLPNFLRPRFKDYLEIDQIGAIGDETGEQFEQRMSDEFVSMFDNHASRQSYFNGYLNDENNLPSQGTLIAFAKVLGVKLHCWQDNGGDNLRLVDNMVHEQNWKHNFADVHILQDGNHFDRLDLVPNKFRKAEELKRQENIGPQRR